MWGEEIEQSGHRERLRNRFLRSGLEGFQNYEALELLLTFAIRHFGSYPEGVSIAILTMNLLVPFINDLTKKKTLGGIK